MAELKTKETKLSVTRFLNSISDDQRREDCFALLKLMQQVTKAGPKMWGSSIVGFGTYHYKYASGHEGDMCLVGFSPRKQALTMYVMPGSEQHAELLKNLGKYKGGKACIYVDRLDDVHLPTLKKLIRQSIDHLTKAHNLK
jgi:hypothetical protein